MDVVEIVRRDFDRISAIDSQNKWDHNTHYHPFLLKHLPQRGGICLDIGCGTGDFSRILSRRFEKVEAIDLSSGMLEKAREQSKGISNIHYIEGNFLDYPTIENYYDGICSIATVHHLPLESVLAFAKRTLKPGGVLAILDLYENENALDWICSASAVPVNLVLKMIKNRGCQISQEEKDAWREHAKNDHYLKTSEILTAVGEAQVQAQFKKHFFWRYSLIYKKV